ncbi:MAG: tetratricopeptide repeat protein [Bryobacteraceae bacterium]|nr:tetratricopeptide repeat protein [Bryobacteraceae bacterium]
MSVRKLFLFVALSLLTVSCSRDPETVKKAYLERGNEYFKNGKYKEAAIMYKSALKKDLRFGEAYYKLGLAELRMGRYSEAVRTLRRAVELQPDNLDASSQLADIYLAAYLRDTKRQKDFLKELEQIATPVLKKDPNSFLGLRIKGYLALAGGNDQEALAAFEAAHKVKPLAPEIILPLAQTLTAAGKFEEAEKLAYQMIEKDKTFSPVYDWLYLQYTSRNRIEDGEKIYATKANNNPKQATYLLQLAGHYFLTQRRADMDKTIARITSNLKDFPLGRAQVGDFYFRIRDVDAAVKHYEAGVKEEPEQRSLYQKRLVETLVSRNRRQEAQEMVSQILKDHPDDFEAVAMRASLWLQDGNREKVQDAINELNAVIVKKPENFVLRYNLGRAYVAKGDLNNARVQFQEALKYRADYTPARIALAQISLSRNEFAKSLQLAEEILNYDRNNLVARMIRTSSRMGLGDLPTARGELNQILEVNPNLPDALFQLGVLNFKEQKGKEAMDTFLKLRRVAPNDPRGLVGQVETLVSQKKFDEALGLMENEIRMNPDRTFYRMAKANTCARAGRFEEAIKEYRHLLSKSPRAFDVQVRLAETLRQKGDMPAAIEEFKKAKDINPADPTASLRLAMLLEQGGRAPEAKPLYEQVLKLEPDNAVALNNLAYMLAESNADLDQALSMAQRAKAKYPHHTDIADTLGWVYLKKNLSDNALQIFRELVEKQETNPIYRYHLAMALAQKGDKPSAKRELENALRHKPNPQDEKKIREMMSRI